MKITKITKIGNIEIEERRRYFEEDKSKSIWSRKYETIPITDDMVIDKIVSIKDVDLIVFSVYGIDFDSASPKGELLTFSSPIVYDKDTILDSICKDLDVKKLTLTSIEDRYNAYSLSFIIDMYRAEND